MSRPNVLADEPWDRTAEQMHIRSRLVGMHAGAKPGDVVSMPRGIDGLHTLTNPTDEPARVLAVSTMPVPEVVFYPELRKVGVATCNPFESVPESGDSGVVGLFDLSARE